MAHQSQHRFRFPGRPALAACLWLVLHSGISLSSGLLETPAAAPAGFSLRDLTGQARRLGDFDGHVVLINFWASWCRPCIDEMPSLQRLAEALKDVPFVVVAINVGESQRRVEAAKRRLEIDFPVLLDEDNAAFRSWGATVLPAARVIDCSGKIRFRVEGPLEWDQADVIETLRALAAEGCGD